MGPNIRGRYRVGVQKKQRCIQKKTKGMQAGHGNLGTRSRLWSLFLIFPIAAVPTMIFYFWYGEWLHIVLICLLYLQLLCRSSE